MTKLQKQKMRIAVAKDVLKSLPKLNVEQGTYLEGNVPEAVKTKGSKAVAKALKAANCTVCALGACLVSLVGLDNKYKFHFGDYDADYDSPTNVVEDSLDIFLRLRAIFSRPQLALIESAFERMVMSEELTDAQSSADGMSEWLDLAVKFSYNYGIGAGAECLEAIMRNIISNKGLFIPIPGTKAIQ